MPTAKSIESQIFELSNTISDLSVGLQCHDTEEVQRKALLLEKLADEFGVSSLSKTALAMAHSAESGNLEVAISLEPEIHEHLNQAVLQIRKKS